MDLWRSELGGVVSLELTLVGAVLVAGLVPAMETTRDRIRDGLASVGAAVERATEPTPIQSQAVSPTCLTVCRTQWIHHEP